MNIVDPPCPGIVTKQIWVPNSIVFTNAQPTNALVLHKTASAGTAEDIANFFAGPNNHDGKSAHFVVGQDGEVVQCVHLVDGAGANCCVESGHDPFWDQFNPRVVGTKTGTDLNTLTISIEHCDPTSDNSTFLTTAQQQASFSLILWLVHQYGFDINTQIKGHNSIDPLSRARCPGNYPWSTLMALLQVAQWSKLI